MLGSTSRKSRFNSGDGGHESDSQPTEQQPSGNNEADANDANNNGEGGLSTTVKGNHHRFEAVSKTSSASKTQKYEEELPSSPDELDESVASTALHVMEHIKKDSVFFAQHKYTRLIPTFSKHEVVLGPLLGEGEFGSVYEVKRFEIQQQSGKNGNQKNQNAAEAEAEQAVDYYGYEDINENDEDPTIDDDQGDHTTERNEIKQQMIQHPLRNQKARYAVKQLRRNISPSNRKDAILDLACEAEHLSRIIHPNIVRLRATVGKPGTPSFMLIMDRLTQTLDQRIKEWRVARDQLRGKSFLGFRHPHADKVGLEMLFQERLLAAYDVARALRHLHSHKLLFRDLKPQNLGTDPRGDFRLFDFGLIKELKQKDLVKKPDGYNATGVTGSRRYMAPEVVKCQPYGFSADVFGFGLLCWQIFALQTPFQNYNAAKHMDRVVVGGERPNKNASGLAKAPLKALLQLIQQCWDAKPEKRPTMDEVCNRLQVAVESNHNGEEEHVFDRSNYLRRQSKTSQRNMKKLTS